MLEKKLKNKIKRIINKGSVDCYIRYNQAGKYRDYQFYGNRSDAIKEARRWIWVDYEQSSQMDLQHARDERKQNLESLKKYDTFDQNGMPAYLLFKLDKNNLLNLFNKNVLDLAGELEEDIINKYNQSFSRWRIIDLEDAISIVDNRISKVTDEEERQELVDNKEAVAMALVLLCSYFDYNDLKKKKKAK